MTRPTYQCESCRHWHVLAMVMPTRPGIYKCLPCLDAADQIRDQAAAAPSTTPIDQDTRRLLGTWRMTKGSVT